MPQAPSLLHNYFKKVHGFWSRGRVDGRPGWESDPGTGKLRPLRDIQVIGVKLGDASWREYYDHSISVKYSNAYVLLRGGGWLAGQDKKVMVMRRGWFRSSKTGTIGKENSVK